MSRGRDVGRDVLLFTGFWVDVSDGPTAATRFDDARVLLEDGCEQLVAPLDGVGIVLSMLGGDEDDELREAFLGEAFGTRDFIVGDLLGVRALQGVVKGPMHYGELLGERAEAKRAHMLPERTLELVEQRLHTRVLVFESLTGDGSNAAWVEPFD